MERSERIFLQRVENLLAQAFVRAYDENGRAASQGSTAMSRRFIRFDDRRQDFRMIVPTCSPLSARVMFPSLRPLMIWIRLITSLF